MNLLKTTKKFWASAAFLIFTLISAVVLSAGTSYAANVQEEGAIYAKNVTQGTSYNHAGTTANAGDTVSFEVYYHDLESPTSGLNAINVRVKANLQTSLGTVHNVNAVISGDNFATINDGRTNTSVTTNVATTMQFIPGTVTWRHDVGTNANPVWVTTPISDDIVTNPNGAIIEQVEQPCNNFAATVAFQAKVVAQPTPPKQPVFSCDAFNLVADVNRNVKVSVFEETATDGAVFKNAVVDWGDKTAPLTAANIIGQTHKYAADGTYLVTATAHFTVNGKDVTAGGPQCQKQVTFKTTTPPKIIPPPTTPPPVTPAPPTALVNTGPGSVIGLFAAVTAAGAVFHRWLLARRLSRV